MRRRRWFRRSIARSKADRTARSTTCPKECPFAGSPQSNGEEAAEIRREDMVRGGQPPARCAGGPADGGEPALLQHPAEFAREFRRMTLRDVAECRELVEIEAAGSGRRWRCRPAPRRRSRRPAARRSACRARIRDRRRHSPRRGCAASERRSSSGSVMVLGATLGRPAAMTASVARMSLEGEQHLADRAAMQRRAVADLEVDRDALRALGADRPAPRRRAPAPNSARSRRSPRRWRAGRRGCGWRARPRRPDGGPATAP